MPPPTTRMTYHIFLTKLEVFVRLVMKTKVVS